MKALLIVLALVVLAIGIAYAQSGTGQLQVYLSGRDFLAASDVLRPPYVAGVFDAVLLTATLSTPNEPMPHDIRIGASCLRAMRLSPGEMARLMSAYLTRRAEDQKTQDAPAAVVVLAALSALCPSVR